MNASLNNHGSAMVTAMVVSLVVVSGVTLYSLYSRVQTRGNVEAVARQKALDYADAGLNSALASLRFPTAGQSLAPGGTLTQSTTQTNGSYQVSFVRGDHQHRMYITADATGYYHFSSGKMMDPVTPGNPRSVMASVHAVILFASVTEFVAAVNSPLEISDNSDFCTSAIPPVCGDVYGLTVSFIDRARLNRAYAVNPVLYGPNVTFYGSPPTVQLSASLNVTTVDPVSTRPFFKNRGTAATAGMFNGTSVPADPPSHVYFDETNAIVDIGTPGPSGGGPGGLPLTVNGVYTIYATGDIYIHNNIVLANSNSWLALVSEGTIYLAADAPDQLTLKGTFVANGGIQAKQVLPTRSGALHPCALTITGGIVGQSINTSAVWQTIPGPSNCERDYRYPDTSVSGPDKGFKDPNLYLPNISTLVDYRITNGRATPRSQQANSQPLVYQE